MHAFYKVQSNLLVLYTTFDVYRQHFAATCFKNGWTATTPELINVSADELVPVHVTHTHIPCPPELRLACLAHILRSELSEKKVDIARHRGGESAQSSLDESQQEAQTTHTQRVEPAAQVQAQAQAIVFLDEKQLSDIDRYREVIQAVLDEHGASSDGIAISNSGGDWQVDILLESMSLDARQNTMQRFRYCIFRCDGEISQCPKFFLPGLAGIAVWRVTGI